MVAMVTKYLESAEWRRQHGWRKAIWSTMARMGLTGLHGLPMNRRWVEIHRRKMPLENLDRSLVGMKIVQISDIHYSPVVWRKYLVQYVHWINEMEPDLVVVTGDLVTGGYRFSNRVAALLSHLKARHGVVCTFGNHDYSMFGKNGSLAGKHRANHLEKNLVKHGLIVLRNKPLFVRVNGAKRPLALVGLDDEWSGHIDPDVAWRGVDPKMPIICLNHNPANVLELMEYPWQWMLSGHTHGRQIGKTALGRRLFPKKYRHYTHGYYAVRGRHLYVNRGLSYGQRVEHWCKPEITVFRLTRANGEDVTEETVELEDMERN